MTAPTAELADLLASLKRIGDGSDGAPPTLPPQRCAGNCDAIVPTRGGYCDACAKRFAAELRANYVAAAYASLPSGWDWARFGDPIYETVAAKQLRSGVPVKPIHDAARAWRRGVGTIALLGPTGSGKTAAATAIAHRILDYAAANPMPAASLRFAAGLRFVTAMQLATARKKHRLGAGDPPLLAMAAEAPLLILDELGYIEMRHGIEDIQEIIDARNKASLPSIFTSGRSQAELYEIYGDATGRRVCELGQLVDLHHVDGVARSAARRTA